MVLEDSIGSSLQSLEIDDDGAIAQYLAGIMGSDDMTDEEKREVITEYLGSVTEAPLDDFLDKIFIAYTEEHELLKRKEEEEKARIAAEAKERELSALKSDAALSTHDDGNHRLQPRQLSADERRERQRILQRYQYDASHIAQNDEGEDEIVWVERAENAEGGLTANKNADIVKEKERERREKMRKENEEEKERIRRQQEKEKREKEKEKRRTQKREKRRL
ncbi:uncharacterized protein VTP21DRAFT_4326 [Calcarisporiella thermophila]|uniref:uncharacterized protein n=1 Tax=Calcarisporiella thermophila TaxID=911321 RepID=UPI003742BA82